MTALPEVLEKLEPKDIQVSAYPEPVQGGMHVGLPKGVKVTHIPTGITVTCDHERSQHKNRDACLVAIAAALHGPALLASQQYAEANPLGGPASMLETAARRIRAGEDFHEVLADYDLHSGAALLRDAGDAEDAARYRWLRANNIIRVFPVSSGMMSRGGTRILANTKDWLPGDFTYVIDGVTKDVDAAIDAAMHAPGGAGGG